MEDATVRAFGAGFRGPLLSPGDGAYDETRKVWNGMIDRRPALIARCAGVADVVAAVSFARAQGLLVSVRGGGHNTPGVAVCEGGLMIDLAGMKASASIQPGRQRERKVAPRGVSSTGRASSSAWPPQGARFPIPASAG